MILILDSRFPPATPERSNGGQVAGMTECEMDLSIVIVNYNSKEKTLNCLASLFASDLEGITWEAIVVDNHSGEAIAEALKARYPRVRLIQSERNRGMGGGNNLGAKQATGEFLLVLNPDTRVLPEAIRLMLFYLKAHGEAGAVGPKLLYPDGSLQYSCLHFPGLMMPFYRRTFLGRFAKKQLERFLLLGFDHASIKDVDWLMGSCLLIRKELFDKLKGFDERFFMYFEDTDFCRRVWQSGAKVVYLPQAVVIHDHGRASAENPWYLAPLVNQLSRIHLASWLKYLWKWKFR